jgi:flavin-dependent dehydrogenase
VRHGLRGYAWMFPCLIDGAPHANVGVYSVEAAGAGRELSRLLAEQVGRLGAPPGPVKSFPIRWYGRGTRIAAPHVLLAGDAAGVDSLMGEGISFAFEYGRRAAAAAARALAASEFTCSDYEASVAASWMGKKLRRLELGTRLFYGRSWRLWFAVAAHSRQAQAIGIRWYNGVDGWDQRSGWEALRAWWRGSLHPAVR